MCIISSHKLSGKKTECSLSKADDVQVDNFTCSLKERFNLFFIVLIVTMYSLNRIVVVVMVDGSGVEPIQTAIEGYLFP